MCVNVWHECDVDQSMTTSGTFFSPRWDILLKTEFCFLLWNWNCVIWFKKQKPHIKTVFLEHMGRDFNARKSSWKLSSEFIVRHCATGAGASSASDLQRFVSDWSADCTSTSGSWTSTHCRERRHDRWRRLDYTKLLGANFPWAHFCLCIHFTCLRQSPRLVLSAADTSRLAGAARNVHYACFILSLPCVITALRFNSATGASDSSAFRSDAVHRARYRTLTVVLSRGRLFQTRCLLFWQPDKFTLRSGTETLWDARWQPAQSVRLLLSGLFALGLVNLVTKRSVFIVL